MYCTHLLLLMVTCLSYTTNYVVYYVVPDDHYLATNNNTLQHYLNNSKKYFTSHTQLVFLPGKHHLHTDLVVQHVENISLNGISPTQANNTIIHCSYSNSSAHVVISNSVNINIRYISMKECGCLQKKNSNSPLDVLHIFNCSNVLLNNSIFICRYQQCGLVLANVVGFIHLNNITSSHLLITHNMTRGNSTMRIINYSHTGRPSYKHRAVEILLYEHTQYIKITFISIKFATDKAISIDSSTSKGLNEIVIIQMKATCITLEENLVKISIIYDMGVTINRVPTKVAFFDCHFSKIISGNTTTEIGIFFIAFCIPYNTIHFEFSILRCTFHDISLTAILKAYKESDSISLMTEVLAVLIQNTTFSVLNNTLGIAWVEGTHLVLQGPVIITKVKSLMAIIYIGSNTIKLENQITFSLNQARYCIMTSIIVMEECKLDIVSNNFSVIIYTENEPDKYKLNSVICLFQYLKEQPIFMHDSYRLPLQNDYSNYSIVLKENNVELVSNRRFATTHCDWFRNSAFIQFDPYELNKKIIHYINNSMSLKPSIPNDFCYCSDDQHYNCSIDELGPVYPGQTYTLRFILSSKQYRVSAKMLIDHTYNRACKTKYIKDRAVLFTNTCTKIPFTIFHKAGDSCNVYLWGSIKTVGLYGIKPNLHFIDVFRIKISSCPLGFTLSKLLKICLCDPILRSVIISPYGCNIDTQTIPRSASSWITGRTARIDVDNSHTYQVSSHCPFDYCLPHSSHLNLSNPDSQCQFNRIGVLCGRCKEGLSTVFGTSQCKQCSNYYLFLLIAFILAGSVIVIFLFIFNFTVADGSVNGLIFYANIVSINGPVFFPSYEPTKYVYVLTSFLNLDLGIEVCFYNGMDDYAKMWLQLIFPFYLIFIATLLIITSRYSTRIQRLTAHRALPVLATLFLLSYTKILRTVSSVLFSYSTITSLPSKNTTLVWSVDTEVQLFGLKFIVLFIVSLVLFLILLPFNKVLIFTRTLSQFKCINHFKPLLDTYQGPYKDRFYYWTGLQLLLRTVFYVISALDRKTNMMIGILILGVMECVHGAFGPYLSKAKNYQELLLVFNLQALFAVSLYTTSNSNAVYTLVSIGLMQFVIFILYQKPRCRKVANAALTILLARLKLSNYFHSTVTQLNLQLINTPPDITHNPMEFREPLIGQDE